MLRRLEKRILVDLPSLEAREAMLKQYLPPVIHSVEGSVEIKSQIDYEELAKVHALKTFSSQYRKSQFVIRFVILLLKKLILHLHKSHNTSLLPPKILHNHCLQVLLGHDESQGKFKTMPMQNYFGGRSGVLWYCASREFCLYCFRVLLF